MPIYECQVAMWDGQSSLPRDAATNTIFLDDRGVTTDPDGLASDLLDMYAAKLRVVPMECKLYDAEATAPRDVLGFASRNSGASGTPGSWPREVAICLSYFAGANRPTSRGRIYLPWYLVAASGAPGERPSTAQRATALSWATEPNSSFPDIGGADVTWVQYSRKLRRAAPVSGGWVDDEWDTVRSRGLRASTRTTFTRQG